MGHNVAGLPYQPTPLKQNILVPKSKPFYWDEVNMWKGTSCIEFIEAVREVSQGL